MGALTQPAGRHKAPTQPACRRNPPPTTYPVGLLRHCVSVRLRGRLKPEPLSQRPAIQKRSGVFFDLAPIRSRSRFELGSIWGVRARRQTICRSIVWTAAARPAARAVSETQTQPSAFETCNVCGGRRMANSAATLPRANSKYVLRGLRKTNATVAVRRQSWV